MDTVAVLPIKTFSRAKHRLAEAVEPPERRELAEAMVGDVLDALGAVDGLDGVIAVTAEPRAAGRGARARAPRSSTTTARPGQSAAAALGVAAAREQGAERVLLVPGDCPALDPGEVAALLARATRRRGDRPRPPRRRAPTRCCSRPPDAIEPSFGPGSFARHAARARAAGVAARVAALPSLGLDVDTPDDLAALRAALAARPGGAPRTRALLEAPAATRPA